jgi:HEPN domain-containing protein
MTGTPASVSAWLGKAQGDLDAAAVLSAQEDPHWDIVVFHAQQAAEKFLKALLVRNGQRPPNVHDLTRLLHICVPYAPGLTAFVEDCVFLSPLAAVSRYPGEELASPRADGERSLGIARRMSAIVRTAIAPTGH